MSVLRNNTLFLRAVEPEDLDVLYEWENDTALWMKGDTINPYSRFTIKMYIERSICENALELGQMRLMICLAGSGSGIGMIDIFDLDTINGKAALGLLIDGKYRGNGYSDMSIDLACSYAGEVLMLHQLYAHIAVDNAHCIKCFERNGFVRSGILKDWKRFRHGYTDVFVYQKFFSVLHGRQL